MEMRKEFNCSKGNGSPENGQENRPHDLIKQKWVYSKSAGKDRYN